LTSFSEYSHRLASEVTQKTCVLSQAVNILMVELTVSLC